jgi:Ca2+-binding EF-hand superfamily protein
MADLLSVDQITELRGTFAMFDRDGDGNITLAELTEALRTLGQNVAREDVRQMVEEADLDANGVVDFPEFLALIANRLNDAEEAENDLVEAFKFYDLNNTGLITATNLMYAMAKLGCRLTPEEADEMIREADLDMDGKLNYRDFRRVMKQTTDFGVSRTAGTVGSDSQYQSSQQQQQSSALQIAANSIAPNNVQPGGKPIISGADNNAAKATTGVLRYGI